MHYRIRVGVIAGADLVGFRPQFEDAKLVCEGDDHVTQVEIPYSELAMYIRAAGAIPTAVIVDPALRYAHVEYEREGVVHRTHGLVSEVVPWVVRRFLENQKETA